MTEDLLEEMDGDMEDGFLDREKSPTQKPLKKQSFVKRLLPSKKKLLLILLIGVALIGIFAGVWFFFFRGTPEEALLPNETSVTEQGSQAGQNVSNNPDTMDKIIFEDIVVLEPFERIPLKANSSMGFVSLDVSLELIDPVHRKQVVAMQDRIRKIIMDQVREMRWLELRNPEGKIQLKYELIKQINAVLPRFMVRNVYFTNLIMQ